MVTTDACSETFRDVKQLIYKVAWRCHRKTGIPLEDCVAEGQLAYCYAYKYWDPDKSVRFTTYLHKVLENTMKDLVHDYRRQHIRNIDPEVLDQRQGLIRQDYIRQGYIGWFDSLTQELSDDARTILTAIIEGPAELASLHLKRNQSTMKHMVVKYMVKLGWSVARVIDGLSEVEQALVEG
jgi:RNA polymerase sigma factor (sigma-70 family)